MNRLLIAQIKVEGYCAGGTLKGKARIQYSDQQRQRLRTFNAFFDAYFGGRMLRQKMLLSFHFSTNSLAHLMTTPAMHSVQWRVTVDVVEC